MKQNIQRIHKKGFTLIETLVAITVLLIAIVAPMTLAQDGIVAARLAQDQIVAFYLAQEGVEVVRNMRDENKLEGFDQLVGPLADCIVDPAIPAERGCYIDATKIVGTTFEVNECSASGCPVLRTNNEKYTYNTSGLFEDTKYSREIKVWYVSDPDPKEVKVEVRITWPFLQGAREYVLRENLLQW